MRNVPIVYLKSNKCGKLINKKVENYFRDSFFIIDTDENNWEFNLIKILNLPMADLKLLWDKKMEKRDYLVKNYLLGPAGNSAIRAANYVDNFIRKSNV